MSENRIKVGLSAYGLSGKVFHAPFLDYLPEFDLKYIVHDFMGLFILGVISN